MTAILHPPTTQLFCPRRIRVAPPGQTRPRVDRHWIGIDITSLAIGLIRNRLADAFGGQAKYEVIGEPVSLPDAMKLARDDPYQFQWWALGRRRRASRSSARRRPRRKAPSGSGSTSRACKGEHVGAGQHDGASGGAAWTMIRPKCRTTGAKS